MDQEFDHLEAQKYELTYSERFMSENGRDIWRRIDEARNSHVVHPLIKKEFFGDSDEIWEAFSEDLSHKSLLDIGTGPVPATAGWPWVPRRYTIDPLTSEYDRICRQMFGRSWFDGTDARTAEAEHLQQDLVGKIDGAIYCRNCLDHCREPYIILANISAYAAKGCSLLLWTDLFHLDGHDDGHSNITRDREGFRRVIEQFGFEIVREVPQVVDRPTLQFGCFAVKR